MTVTCIDQAAAARAEGYGPNLDDQDLHEMTRTVAAESGKVFEEEKHNAFAVIEYVVRPDNKSFSDEARSEALQIAYNSSYGEKVTDLRQRMVGVIAIVSMT